MIEFNWENIVRSAVFNIGRQRKVPHGDKTPYWHWVAELCGLGGASAIELCKRCGMDPHTALPGKPLEYKDV